jgi:hypothetical protein
MRKYLRRPALPIVTLGCAAILLAGLGPPPGPTPIYAGDDPPVDLSGTAKITYKIATRDGGETFKSVGGVTNYDYHYQLLAVQENVQVAKDGSFRVSGDLPVGAFSVRQKVRSKEGREGSGGTSADAFLRADGKFAADFTLKVHLEWACRNPSRSVKSDWNLTDIASRGEDESKRVVLTYKSKRNTTLNQAPAADPLPLVEEIQVEYKRKKKADLEITATVAPALSVFNGTIIIEATVKNLGPDESCDAVVSIDYEFRDVFHEYVDTDRYEIAPSALDQGSVRSQAVNQVRFDLGNLVKDKTARFRIEVKDYSQGWHPYFRPWYPIPDYKGQANVSVFSAGDNDPDLSNNSRPVDEFRFIFGNSR